MPSRWRTPAIVSLAVAVLLSALQAAMVLPLLDELPNWDQWVMVPVWRAHYEGGAVLSLLLEPYNGHFSVLPRSLFYVLGLATNWNVRFEVYASYVACLLTAVLLLRLLYQADPRLLVLAAPVAVHVFSLQQYANFTYGFPLDRILAQLLVTASVYALTRPREWASFGLGALAATAASLSFASALVIWPIGLLAVSTGGSRRIGLKLALWVGFAVPCVLLARYAAVGSGAQLEPSQLAFVLAQLGHPIAPRQPTPLQAVALGAVLVTTSVLVSVIAIRAAGFRRLRPFVLMGLSAFLAAFLVALGRSRYGLEQALSWHYVTSSYPLVLLALVGLGQWALAGTARLRVGMLALAAVAATVQPVVVSAQWFPTLRQWSAARQAVTRALVKGQASDDQIRSTHHADPETVRYGMQVLRRYGLSVFRANGPSVFELPDYVPVPAGAVDLHATLPSEGNKRCLPREGPVAINGWAIASRKSGGRVDGVYLRLDDHSPVSARLGVKRQDVAEFFGSPDFLASGYAATLDGVTPGLHRLVVLIRHRGREEVLLDTRLPACAR